MCVTQFRVPSTVPTNERSRLVTSGRIAASSPVAQARREPARTGVRDEGGELFVGEESAHRRIPKRARSCRCGPRDRDRRAARGGPSPPRTRRTPPGRASPARPLGSGCRRRRTRRSTRGGARCSMATARWWTSRTLSPRTNRPCPASSAMSASPIAATAISALSMSSTPPVYSSTTTTLPPPSAELWS